MASMVPWELQENGVLRGSMERRDPKETLDRLVLTAHKVPVDSMVHKAHKVQGTFLNASKCRIR